MTLGYGSTTIVVRMIATSVAKPASEDAAGFPRVGKSTEGYLVRYRSWLGIWSVSYCSDDASRPTVVRRRGPAMFRDARRLVKRGRPCSWKVAVLRAAFQDRPRAERHWISPEK